MTMTTTTDVDSRVCLERQLDAGDAEAWKVACRRRSTRATPARFLFVDKMK